MKRHIILHLVLFLLVCNFVKGQSPCPIPIIKTDPSNPFNTENPDLKNNFDWRAQTFTFYNQMTTGSDNILNFFYQSNDPSMVFIAQNAFSDFKPSDGWELVKRDFGLLANGNRNPVSSNFPYFILYNRYTGVLRVVASIFGLGAQQAINVTIQFVEPINVTNFDNLQYSGMFGLYNSPAYPLDSETEVKKLSSMVKYPGPGKNFFYADFQLGYDPCTCLFESAIEVTFNTFNTFDIQLYGRLLGISEQIATQNGTAPYQMLDTANFLTSVYRDNVQDSKANAGMLMYEYRDHLVEDLIEKQNQLNFKEDLTKGLEYLAIGMDVGSKFVDKVPPIGIGGVDIEAKAGLESAALITDFFAGKLDGGGESMPSIIHAEMSLNGTLTESVPVGASTITIANPGSNKSSSKPEFNNDGNLHPNTLYPTYNQPLGVFAMLNTPQANKFYHYERRNNSSDPHFMDIKDYFKMGWQLTSPIKYMFNPALDIDYANTTVKGAIVIESENKPVSYYHNIDSIYSSSGQEVFMTPFMPLERLYQFTPSLEYYINIGNPNWGQSDVQVKTYIKLTVTVQYNSLNSNGVPNRTAFILKYPIMENQTSTDFTGIPIQWQVQNVNPSIYPTRTYPNSTRPLFEDSLTIGNFNFTLSNPNGTINGNPQYVYSYKNIHINGHLTEGSGVSKVTITSASNIIQEGESIIEGEFILQTNDSDLPPVPSPPITNSTEVTNFCNNVNTSYRPYLANQSAEKLGNYLFASTDNVPATSYNLTLDIYPNPFFDAAWISYSVPQGDNVNIFISDLLGRKVLDLCNTYKSQGNYSINLSSEKLEDGIYLCTILTGGKVITKRISVVK